MEKLFKKRKSYPGIPLFNSVIPQRLRELIALLNQAGVTNFDIDYYYNTLYVFDTSGQEKELLQHELRKNGFSASSGYLFFNNPFVLFLISLPLTGILYSPEYSFDFFQTGLANIATVIILYVLFWLHSGWIALKSLRHKRADSSLFFLIAITVSFVLTLSETQSVHVREFSILTGTLVLFSFFVDVAAKILLLLSGKKMHLPTPVFPDTANLIVYNPDNSVYDFPVNKTDITSGDILGFGIGNIVPADIKVLTGSAWVLPFSFNAAKSTVHKGLNDIILSGSKIIEGNIKGYALASAENSFYQSLQQKIALTRSMIWLNAGFDRRSFFFIVLGASIFSSIIMSVSGTSFVENALIFISLMVVFAVVSLGFNSKIILDTLFIQSLKKSVLVCRYSVFKKLASINRILFDPLGIIKDGSLQVSSYKVVNHEYSENDFKGLVFSIFKFSSDPVATCIKRSFRSPTDFKMKKQKSERRHEWIATDNHNVYKAITSLPNDDEVLKSHDLFILKNEVLIGCINFSFELKQDVKPTIDYFHREKIDLGFIQTYQFHAFKQLKQFLGITQTLREDELADKRTPALFFLNNKQELSFSSHRTNITAIAAENTEDIKQKNDLLLLDDSTFPLSYIYEMSKAFCRFHFVRYLFLAAFLIIVILILVLGLISPIQIIFIAGIFYLMLCGFTYLFSSYFKRMKND